MSEASTCPVWETLPMERRRSVVLFLGRIIIGHPPTLSQERDPLLVSTSPENVTTRHQWFAPARLRDPHLTGIFSPNAHDNGF